jgi:RNA polymerase sigma-70 factor (ECF subfamily)
MDELKRLQKGLKEGNIEVFEEIYRLYYAPLCFYCLRYVGDMEEAKEIVQGLFLKIWLRKGDLKINTSVKSYLYKSVQNYALNYLKQEQVKKKYTLDKEYLPKASGVNGQQKLEEEELKIKIKKAILKLPEKRRKIFELNRFENMKYQQIAEHLSISVKTVEAQMSKSLEFLRKELKEYLPLILWLTVWFYMN